MGLGHGSCAAAVYLSRPVLVADMSKDPYWAQNRAAASKSGLSAAWSTPIKSTDGRTLGALGVFQHDIGLPDAQQADSIAHASKLAGIAIDRLLADNRRKQAEQAVIAEKERAQVTLQSIGDGVISTCARGLIEYLNPVAEKLTGWSIEEARGRPLSEVLNLIDEATRQHVSHSLERLQAIGTAAALVTHPVLVTRDGQEVAVQESSAPIRDRNGEVIGAVIVVHDVTARAASEARIVLPGHARCSDRAHQSSRIRRAAARCIAPGAKRRAAATPCCTWTWTSSRSSTTPAATRPETA